MIGWMLTRQIRRNHIKIALTAAYIFVASVGQPVFAGDLSPANYAATARERAEKRETAGWKSTEAQSIAGKHAVISSTASPISVNSKLKASAQKPMLS